MASLESTERGTGSRRAFVPEREEVAVPSLRLHPLTCPTESDDEEIVCSCLVPDQLWFVKWQRSGAAPMFAMQGKGVSIPTRLRRVGFAERQRARFIWKA